MKIINGERIDYSFESEGYSSISFLMSKKGIILYKSYYDGADANWSKINPDEFVYGAIVKQMKNKKRISHIKVFIGD